MSTGTFVAQHLNDFNTITNQLSYVEIEFDNEIGVLILIMSLSNSWETMSMAVSNLAVKMKLNYDGVHDMIFIEEVLIKDWEVFWYRFGLWCYDWGR